MNRRVIAVTLLKYSYPVGIVFLAANAVGQSAYLFAGMLELLIVFGLTELLLCGHRWAGQIINYVLLFLFNVQFTVLYFSSSFLSLAMLNNIDSIETIGGRFFTYLICIVLMLVCTFHPPKKILPVDGKKQIIILGITLFGGSVLLGVTCSEYSMAMNTCYITKEYVEQKNMSAKISQTDAIEEAKFYKAEVENHIAKPENLPEKPNIILIFQEGVSQNIISDDREIMPNVKELQNRSLSFENYYNHTFATYMGLIGQLYSGYQMQNYDENRLVSLQSILSEQGYSTSFINVEPVNAEFTAYLADMDFDELINNEELAVEQSCTISDKHAYELLLQVCEEKNKESEPFFTGIYVLGTHTQWVSEGEKYNGGSDSYLNKFYNADYQFGKFMEAFHTSSLANNTVIIYTTDHATYKDSDYIRVFPEHKRNAVHVDEVPFFIYYKGITAEKIDAAGCNSLDLVPTVLDYLDYSEENYFLGKSLFNQESENEYDTIFQSFADVYSTAHAEVALLDDSRRKTFQENVTEYFALKLQVAEEPYIETVFTNNGLHAEVILYNAEQYEHIWFPMWTIKDGQDDLVWCEGKKKLDGTWRCKVKRSDYITYAVHVYGGINGPEELLIEHLVI